METGGQHYESVAVWELDEESDEVVGVSSYAKELQ